VSEEEGVIQFSYSLTPGESGLAPTAFRTFAAWRSLLQDLRLLGQSEARYGGYGFGNMSQRTGAGSFVVTGSQTSGAPELLPEHLVRIDAADLEHFSVAASGTCPPSSESLTHAMLYAADPALQVVYHVHSPTLWRARDALGLPATVATVPYGTPAMADAVGKLLRAHPERPLLFVTAGHEDGVFCAGMTFDACGSVLIQTLAAARAISHGAHDECS